MEENQNNPENEAVNNSNLPEQTPTSQPAEDHQKYGAPAPEKKLWL